MRKLFLAGVAGAVFAGHGAAARDYSNDVFASAHARRGEVNSRLNLQHQRIDTELRDGRITPAQAQALHEQDAQMRAEERAMASQNGGRISKSEQDLLNRQEGTERQELNQ